VHLERIVVLLPRRSPVRLTDTERTGGHPQDRDDVVLVLDLAEAEGRVVDVEHRVVALRVRDRTLRDVDGGLRHHTGDVDPSRKRSRSTPCEARSPSTPWAAAVDGRTARTVGCPGGRRSR
jgi:hypothetical protein